MVVVEVPSNRVHCLQKSTYSYRSAPRTPWTKSKCRDESIPLPYGNIMFDRRVVRGPAFVHHPIPTAGMESQAAREAEARRRAMARRKAQKARILKLRVATPPPVEGRKHEPVQTDVYLEEVFDHPIEKMAETQTDLMVDRPETPPFVPTKNGIDVATQIYHGELFDFDLEVKPILEVLVGKTLEQSLVEVMEEEELEAIREQQRQFKEIRDAERAEQQRLEQQELRRKREMEERIKEQEEAVASQMEASERVAAAVLTTGYLETLLPSVLDGLKDSGQMPDPVEQDVQENFLGWLMDEVKEELQKTIESEELISGLVGEILRRRAEAFARLGDGVLELEGPPVPQEVSGEGDSGWTAGEGAEEEEAGGEGVELPDDLGGGGVGAQHHIMGLGGTGTYIDRTQEQGMLRKESSKISWRRIIADKDDV